MTDSSDATPANETSPAAPIALVLIGNELLSGKVSDLNGGYCIRRLAEVGGRLGEIRVIPDDPVEISRTVRALSERFAWVITSGGIGPTHDDITMAAIADAFALELHEDAELRRRIEQRFVGDADKQRVWARMAQVPTGCELIGLATTVWPVYRVQNVFVLPGVPQIFELQFDAIRDRFSGKPRVQATMYVTEGEGVIADPLTAATDVFEDVDFGSYPVHGNADYRTRVTVEALDPARVESAVAWLREALPAGVVHMVTTGERELRD